MEWQPETEMGVFRLPCLSKDLSADIACVVHGFDLFVVISKFF